LDAALYEPAPPYPGKGRPRKKGARLPTLQSLFEQTQTPWQQVEIAWYGGWTRKMEVVSDTAVWYHTGKPPVSIRWVLIRDPKGEYDPVALLCTQTTYPPMQIVSWFVRRWTVEVTFQEARAHLGVETQRQWSDLAIGRTTPALLGLFSWVTLVAHQLHQSESVPVRQTAWYHKPAPTFSDALAWVRHLLWWHSATFSMSPAPPEMLKLPKPFVLRLVNSLAYAT